MPPEYLQDTSMCIYIYILYVYVVHVARALRALLIHSYIFDLCLDFRMAKHNGRQKKRKPSKKIKRNRAPLKGKDLVQLLMDIKAPAIVIYLVVLILNNPNFETSPTLDGVEWFCGDRAITKSFVKKGYNFRGYDIRICNTLMDIMTTEGFLTALNFAVKLCLAGFGHLAIVCSSWVFMNSGLSKRSIANPSGNMHQTQRAS